MSHNLNLATHATWEEAVTVKDAHQKCSKRHLVTLYKLNKSDYNKRYPKWNSL